MSSLELEGSDPMLKSTQFAVVVFALVVLCSLVGCGTAPGTTTTTTTPPADPQAAMLKQLEAIEKRMSEQETARKAEAEANKLAIEAQKAEIAALKAPAPPYATKGGVNGNIQGNDVEFVQAINPVNGNGKQNRANIVSDDSLQAIVNARDPKREIMIMPMAPAYPLEKLPPTRRARPVDPQPAVKPADPVPPGLPQLPALPALPAPPRDPLLPECNL